MLCKEFFDILSLVQFNTRILLQIVISLNIQEHCWMSFEKQDDGTLSVTIDGTVYSVDTV